MRNRFLRIAVVAVLICACTVLLGGCFFMDRSYDDSYSFSDFTDMRESITEGYFKLTIHTDKDTFAQGETIDCWAEIEYIGDQDSITVYNTYGLPITMDMYGGNVSYSSSTWIYENTEDTLTLVKNQPVRCTLSESVPHSSSPLPGTYEIDAYVNLSLTQDDAVCYNGYVSAVIVVEDQDED